MVQIFESSPSPYGVNKRCGPICNAGEAVVGSPSMGVIPNLTEHGPGQTALVVSALRRGSDEAISSPTSASVCFHNSGS